MAIGVKRPSATRDLMGVRFRGLKPTATIMGSLRDGDFRAARLGQGQLGGGGEGARDWEFEIEDLKGNAGWEMTNDG